MQMARSTAGGSKGIDRLQAQVALVAEVLRTLKHVLLVQRSASQAA